MWRSKYEDDKLIEKVDKLWDEVQPLFNELHKYVRYQLNDLYGDKMDKKSEFIPAHLLGNMWVSGTGESVFGFNFNHKHFTGSKLGTSLRSY